MVDISVDNSSGSIVWYDKGTNPPEKVVYNPGDIAWVLVSTTLVWIMIPGIGFFYSGLLRRKNALSMNFMSMMAIAVVSFQWFFWGFSLTFSESGSGFIGDLRHFALQGVLEKRSMGSGRIPSIVFCVYQLMFAAITPVLALGAFAERAHLGPMIVFVFIWSTLVYNPIAYWTWNSNGWGSKLGNLDFAGGTPVHISSGSAALAISFYLKKRLGYGTVTLSYGPHNTTYVVLGTMLMWFGWFGFTGGAALGANLRTAQACIVTNLAASVSGLTWMAWDYYTEQRWTVVGFCSGAIAGLVAITPGSGYVGAPAAVLFGFLAGTLCNFATAIKYYLRCDDALDIFATHAVGGIIGNILTAIFAQASIAGYDLTTITGGWLDRNYIQLAYHLADSCAGLVYSFTMTTLILWAMHFIPGLCLRVSEGIEQAGIDKSEMGESAYDYASFHLPLAAPRDRLELNLK